MDIWKSDNNENITCMRNIDSITANQRNNNTEKVNINT